MFSRTFSERSYVLEITKPCHLHVDGVEEKKQSIQRVFFTKKPQRRNKEIEKIVVYPQIHLRFKRPGPHFAVRPNWIYVELEL